MSENKLVAGVAQKPKFSMMIQKDGYKKLINSTLGDPKRAQRFIASITSAVAVNPALQGCDAGTILSAALLGESLNLPCSPQLGYFYMVPYEDKKRNCTVAQFQLGYKGYIQLAIRSGQYSDIDVMNVKEGEYQGRDKCSGKHIFKFIADDETRDSLPTIGYMAYLQYKGGDDSFRKVVYWTKEKMITHADRYSKAFSKEAVQTKKFSKVSFADYEAGNFPKDDEWKYSSFWYKDFDVMAHKTLLRHLISKWGIMSVEFQEAYSKDMAVIGADGTPEYLEDGDDIISASPAEDDTQVDEVTFEVNRETGEVSLDDL